MRGKNDTIVRRETLTSQMFSLCVKSKAVIYQGSLYAGLRDSENLCFGSFRRFAICNEAVNAVTCFERETSYINQKFNSETLC